MEWRSWLLHVPTSLWSPSGAGIMGMMLNRVLDKGPESQGIDRFKKARASSDLVYLDALSLLLLLHPFFSLNVAQMSPSRVFTVAIT